MYMPRMPTPWQSWQNCSTAGVLFRIESGLMLFAMSWTGIYCQALAGPRSRQLRQPSFKVSWSRLLPGGAPVHAGKVLAILKQLFRFGVSNGTLEYNPAGDLDALALGVENNVRNRVLDDGELRWVWNVLDQAPRIALATRSAIKVLLLTGLRSGELRLAEWGHYCNKNRTLTIPPEHQKLSPRAAASARPFVVPLPPIADQLVRALRGNDKRWIFAAKSGAPAERRSWGRAVTRLIRQTQETDNPIEHFSIHDLRRTMRSRLGALGVAPHLAERCLNHSLGRILHTYDQHDYLDERRAALEKWADALHSIVHSNPGETSVSSAS